MLFVGNPLLNAQTEYKIESFKTALVTKKMMFDWYGKWDKVLYTETQHSLLIWTNRRIINESTETFTVIASSLETNEGLFGSIQILTSDNRDALAYDSPYREYLNEFIKTLSKQKNRNMRFFKEYAKLE